MTEFSVSVYFGISARVVIVGELDAATAPLVDESLEMVTTDVVMDCTALEFIDSAGFRALDRGDATARARGTSFQVVGLSRFATHIGALLQVPYLAA